MLNRKIAASAWLALLVPALGCSSVNTRNAQHGSSYQTELAKAFEEAAQTNARMPAQFAQPSIDIAQLTKLGAGGDGNFRVYVFPKLSTQANKTNDDNDKIFKNSAHEKASRLGSPMEYDVSTLAVSSCQDFVRQGPLSKFNGRKIFHVSLAKDPSRRCAILEMIPARLKNVDRTLLRRDDQLRVRLFIDDAYNLQGYEMEKFVSLKKTHVLRVTTAAIPQGAASGLSLFPMDIPNILLFAHTGVSKGMVDSGESLDKLAIAQVKRAFEGDFQPVRCAGSTLRYRDYYGIPVEVGWCDGMPFPQYMENGRFVAVTEPMSVR